MGLMSLLNRPRRALLPLPPREDSTKKLAVYNLEEGFHQDLIMLTPYLRLPASKTERNKFLLFVRYPAYSPLSGLPEWAQIPSEP